MTSIDTAIRLMVIGQDLLIAAVFLFGRGSRGARVSGALLMLSVVGHLFTSSSELRDALPILVPVTSLLGLSVSYCLWLFARAIFEAPWPSRTIVNTAVIIGIGVWLIYLGDSTRATVLANVSQIAMSVLALAIVAHAMWLAVQGRPDDLIEHRRTFRLFFVGIVSLQVAAVVISELVLVGSTPPAWLEMTKLVVIAIVTLGLAIGLLRLNADFFVSDVQPMLQIRAEPEIVLDPAENVLCHKLLGMMDDGYYRETGLTISMLAQSLDYPEHRVRRLINGHLGYRNYSAFLNSYRIAAAMEQLADPEFARTPVLTIALDLGYASLGPFNRAFKDVAGMTPTDFRRQKLGTGLADSE